MKNSMDNICIIGKMLQLSSLRKRMLNGEIMRFAYQKKDGSIRTAVGTLHRQAIEANIKGSGVSHNPDTFTYLDLEKMQWRAFKLSNFIGIID